MLVACAGHTIAFLLPFTVYITFAASCLLWHHVCVHEQAEKQLHEGMELLLQCSRQLRRWWRNVSYLHGQQIVACSAGWSVLCVWQPQHERMITSSPH